MENVALGEAVLAARALRAANAPRRPAASSAGKRKAPARNERAPRKLGSGKRRSESERLQEWIGVTRMSGSAKALCGEVSLAPIERAINQVVIEALGGDVDYDLKRDGNRGVPAPMSRTQAFRGLLLREAVRRANEAPPATTLRPLLN